jgi:uncharacterized membrane protein
VPTPARPAFAWFAFFDRLRPERVYLIFALTFGSLLLLANPPFQAPDEYMHYFRIHQLSAGKLVAERGAGSAGGHIPVLASDIASPGDLPGRPERKVSAEYFAAKSRPLFTSWSDAPTRFERFPHTSIYAPTAYWAQLIAVSLGKPLHLGPLLLLYAARFASLLACVLLVYFAIRALPYGQWLLALLLLAPTPLYFYGSCAPDGLLIASATFIVARLARARHLGVAPGTAEMLLLIALGAAIATAKFVYFPVAALIPLLLWKVLPDWTARRRWLGVWVVLCLLPTAGWSQFMSSHFTVTREDIPIDPHAQVRHVLAHPFEFVALVVNTYVTTAVHLAHSVVGVLGWNDTPMPRWFYSAFGAMLLGACFLRSRGQPKFDWLGAGWLVASAVGVFGLVAAGLYAQWNPPGSRELIDGLTGRYLYPVLPALGLALAQPAWPTLGERWSNLVGTLCAATIVVVALTSVAVRFYAW